MNDDATRHFATALFAPTTPPMHDFYEMQQDLMRIHLSAGAEFARRSMEALQSGPAGLFPTAPAQMLGFFNDCMRLSMSPMTLLASSAFHPLASMMGAIAPPSIVAGAEGRPATKR